MLQVIEKHAATAIVVHAATLPADILAMQKRLVEVSAEVTALRKQADGLIFGKFGVDAFAGILPVVGEVYSLYAGTVLMQEAIKAKCSWGTKLSGLALMAVDFAIGTVPVAGDIFDFLFRSHAWFAGMIQTEAETKLAQIEEVRQRLPSLSSEEAEKHIAALRDALLRNGSTETMRFARVGMVALVCMFGMYQCRAAHDVRQESIRLCEAQGKWFCGSRY